MFCWDEETNEESVYIGESENVLNRSKDHIRDYSADKEKFFWNTAVVFLGADLNKAFIRYLENRLYEIAKQSKRYKILTQNTYKNTVLKEADIASMEKFIKYVRILINTLGYKVLEPKKKNSTTSTMDDETLYLKSGAAEAQGLITSEGFVLMTGAKINEKTAAKSLGKGTAADFVFGYSVSGLAQWKNSAGVSLKELATNTIGT